MVDVKAIDPLCDDGRSLFARLSQEQIDRYGRDGGMPLEGLAKPGVIFVAAFLNGEAVGCGAIVPLETGIGELSRIFVDPSARRNGVGAAIMTTLENEATEKYSRLVLETGVAQPESIALYEKCGYVSIPCWGKSADNPKSRCYEKCL
ncbi:MAG: GNAT family N-acetyltransferase [Rhizobiaceae bacterium]|nr:GNAT family N-acetyltransferase [Rhizobiaceae bacterium]